MTNPSQHSKETTRNVFLPHRIDIRLVRASDVLWIGGVVCRVTGYTVREFRDPACHEMVSVM